jgi:hypothetical protein
MDESYPRKRPRPVVSCFRCRDKKLKCDRVSPCQNCVKGNIADTCTYQRGVNGFSKESSSGPTASTNAVEDLQSRMVRVEELLGLRSSKQPSSPAADATPQAIGTVVIKGNRSIFRGQNDRTTLLTRYEPSIRHTCRMLSMCIPCYTEKTALVLLCAGG